MLYDVFLSHRHVDKEWTRELFERLSRIDYDGRRLRAWLDERVLDPGSLSSDRELETALDRSFRLALVLTRETMDSHWVQHEISYFSRTQGSARILVLVRGDYELPASLATCTRIDWSGEPDEPEPMAALLRLLQPKTEATRRYAFGKEVRRAMGSARCAMGEDLNTEPTPEGEALLALLLKPDLRNLDEEGLALTGFRAAAQLLSELDDPEGYNLRLLLGEILALAQLRDPGYARVAADYVLSEQSTSFLTQRNRLLQNKTETASTSHLPFTVARAASKLAEIDAARVDLSTLAAVLQNLDRRQALDGPSKSVAVLVGRTLGKLRGSPLVDALLNALSRWGGNASHRAVAAAVACTFEELDGPIYSTVEMRQRAAQAPSAAAIPPPTPRIARLLMEVDQPLGLNTAIARDIENARWEYTRAHGPWELDAEPWQDLRAAPLLTAIHGGPLVGTLRRITRANMEANADCLGPTEIAVLTETRIVDALFDGVGGFLIDEQEASAPLGTRLAARGARWATCGANVLERIEDGMPVVWWGQPDQPGLGYRVSVHPLT